MNYRSFQQLNASIVRNLHKIPANADLVVGVPRSGLLAANLLALHLNLPLADLDGFKARRLLRGGVRTDRVKKDFDEIRNVVILDDSLQSGYAMRVARKTLENIGFDKNLYFGVVYLKPGVEHPLDFHLEECAMPRAFEWNMFHHPGVMIRSGMEIDGVLCHGPGSEDLECQEKYLNFIRNARPYLKFTGKIGMLVTNRPEKFRRETEEWLERQAIQYSRLFMSGTKAGGADQKMKLFNAARDMFVFFEASLEEARQLACRTGKMVYAVDSREMVYPNGVAGSLRAKRRRLVSLAGGAMPSSVRLALKQLFDRGESGAPALVIDAAPVPMQIQGTMSSSSVPASSIAGLVQDDTPTVSGTAEKN